MKIYYVEDGLVFSDYFECIGNLESLERELDELYDIWDYEEEGCYERR